ncbi:hypothetical protein OIT44_02815 [Weissella ceti]|uniref:Uncharacterized protein n=1 Tax=Weissella ceti TaxID=759620 RepID=A0ABT3E3L4_9LACO|nr:hypothetical protein [Weissella ceti]MCW0953003.1 hypothetical protein [Weissella ceti]QVK11549.1 hypothetical protein KHQ31_04825 [Weissella ceti]
MLKELVIAIVRNYANFTINDVYATDVSMLMMLLDDKKKETEEEPVKRVDFTSMSMAELQQM